MTILAVSLALLLGGWVVHYRLTAARKPRLIYRRTPLTQYLLARLPRLHQRYSPTPWLYNRHLQLFWLLFGEAFARRLRYDESQSLTMVDGGTTSLDWLGLSEAADAPTLLVLPTISGGPQSLRVAVRQLRRATGWRIVMCNRRGHENLRLTSPRFNTMGSTDDLREQIDAIRARFPYSPLYGVGLSAGTGQLGRYLGEEGPRSALRAAAAYAPGYDISVAFGRFNGFYSRKLVAMLKHQFLEPYAKLFGTSESYQRCLAAADLAEFQDGIYGIAGYKDTQDYLRNNNPIPVLERIAVPLLIIGADDDPLCVVENMREQLNLIRRIPDMLLVQTRRGSHCAHYAGWWPHSWGLDVIAEYLVAVDDELKHAVHPATTAHTPTATTLPRRRRDTVRRRRARQRPDQG